MKTLIVVLLLLLVVVPILLLAGGDQLDPNERRGIGQVINEQTWCHHHMDAVRDSAEVLFLRRNIESGPEFERACHKAYMESPWMAPLRRCRGDIAIPGICRL